MLEKEIDYHFNFFKNKKKTPLVRKSILLSVGVGFILLVNGFAQFIYPRHELVKEWFFDPPYTSKSINYSREASDTTKTIVDIIKKNKTIDTVSLLRDLQENSFIIKDFKDNKLSFNSIGTSQKYHYSIDLNKPNNLQMENINFDTAKAIESLLVQDKTVSLKIVYHSKDSNDLKIDNIKNISL